MAIPTLTANSPSTGYIAWTAFNISFGDNSYSVSAGNSNKKFVWWRYNNGSPILEAGDSAPDTLTPDDLILFGNKNGTPVNLQTAGLIEGGLIVDGSILTDALSANCVTSEKILAGAVDTSELAAGAVTTVNLDANAVTADKIAVADFNNYAGDGSFLYDNSWGYDSAHVRVVGNPDPNYMVITKNSNYNRDLYGANLFDVQPGDSFYVSYDVLRPSTNPSTATASNEHVAVGIRATTPSGGMQWPGVITPLALLDGDAVDTWVTVTGVFGVPTNQTYVKATPWISVQGPTTSNNQYWVRNIVIYKRGGGELIVDGSITAKQIAAQAITTDKLSVIVGGGNTVNNSSFEDDTAPLPPYTQSTTVELSTEQAFHGTRSLKLTQAGAKLNSFAYITPAVAGSLHPLTAYTASAWVYVASMTDQAYAGRCFGVANAADTTFLGLDSSLTMAHPVGVWVRHQVSFTTGSTDTSVRVRLYAPQGTVYWDAVQIEPGDVATSYAPKTDEILPGTITAPMISAGAIQAGSAIIADGAIGNAQIGNLDAAKVTTGTLSADRLDAGSITGDKLSVDAIDGKVINGVVVSGSVINVGDNISIDPNNGIVIDTTDGAGNPGLIQFPGDGSPATVTADLNANLLTVQDRLTVLGSNNTVAGSLTLQSSWKAPVNKASVSQSVTGGGSVAFSITGSLTSEAGLVNENGTTWYTVTRDNGTGAIYVIAIDYAAGSASVLKTLASPADPLTMSPCSLTKIGSTYYVLDAYTQQNVVHGKVTTYDSSWAATGSYELGAVHQGDQVGYALGTDGTNLLLSDWYNARVQVLTPATGSVLSTISVPVAAGTTGRSTVAMGSFDYGSTRLLLTDETRLYSYKVSGATATEQVGERATIATGGQYVVGLAWDAATGRIFALRGEGQNGRVFPLAPVPTAVPSKPVTWTRYDTVGTTHESMPSPSVNVAQGTRQWVRVQTDTITPDSGPDDQDSVRVYVGNQLQTTGVPGQSLFWLGAPVTGPAAPTVEGFPQGSLAQIVSQDADTSGVPHLQIKGDGTLVASKAMQAGIAQVSCTTAQVNGAYSYIGDLDIVFAVPFAVPPAISLAVLGTRPDLSPVSYKAVSTAGFTIHVLRGPSGTQEVAWTAMAVTQ